MSTPAILALALPLGMCAFFSLGLWFTGRGYRFASGRVQGIIGVMGSGKSLFAVTKIILPTVKSMQRRGGMVCSHTGRPVDRIITNFKVDLGPDSNVDVLTLDGNRIWDHLLEIAQEHGEWRGEDFQIRLNAIVIIDEAHLFIPSSQMKVAKKAAYVMSMARKMNAEIWWITQSEMKIHKRVRDDSQMIWRVNRSAGIWSLITGPSRTFVAQGWLAEDIKRFNIPPIDKKRYRLTKQAIQVYNSFDLIVPDAEADVSLDSLSRPLHPPRIGDVAPLRSIPMAEPAPTEVDTGSLHDIDDATA